MRYIVAMAVSLLLIVGMFVYAHWMIGCERLWADQHTTLSDIEVTGVNLAYFITNFWYTIIPFLVAIPLAIAALWPRKRRREEESL
jgi:4-amino-4-deoxy-L-arabinose transferase-like glycosyltransferase